MKVLIVKQQLVQSRIPDRDIRAYATIERPPPDTANCTIPERIGLDPNRLLKVDLRQSEDLCSPSPAATALDIPLV